MKFNYVNQIKSKLSLTCDLANESNVQTSSQEVFENVNEDKNNPKVQRRDPIVRDRRKFFENIAEECHRDVIKQKPKVAAKPKNQVKAKEDEKPAMATLLANDR